MPPNRKHHIVKTMPASATGETIYIDEEGGQWTDANPYDANGTRTGGRSAIVRDGFIIEE